MPDTQNTQNTTTSETLTTKPRGNFVWLAILSLVLTLAAWIAGGFSGTAAIVIAACAILAGAFALRSHKQGVRNTAITSIIAAGVLLVVIAAFLIVIYIGLKAV